MAARKCDLFLRNVTILLGLACMALGCGPASLAYLFMPFVDDRVQPKCKLANPDKEIKIVIASRFNSLEVRPDLQPADQELADALVSELNKRFKINKEKVKVEPPQRVRSHLAKLKEWNATELVQLGERLQADYIIDLNIQSLTLMKPNSYNKLYQGTADVEVTVYDAHQPALVRCPRDDAMLPVVPDPPPLLREHRYARFRRARLQVRGEEVSQGVSEGEPGSVFI